MKTSFLHIKFLPVLLLFMVCNLQSYAQPKNRIGVGYGFASNLYYYVPSLLADVSISGKGSTQFGVHYFRNFSTAFSLETGLNYVTDKVQFISFSSGVDGPPRVYTVTVLSVPVYAHYTFARYLFIHGGPLMNLDVNRAASSSVDNQSGIGLGIGLGAKYTLKSFTVFVNPFLKTGPVFSFQKENHQGRLEQSGINFGLSYNF